MAEQPHWYNRNPTAYVGAACADSRLTRYRSRRRSTERRSGSSRRGAASAPRRWLSRRYRRLRGVKIKDVLGRVLIAALLIYVALTIFHLTQGFDFTSALGGGIQDIRVVGVCFGEWNEMKEFIARDSFLGKDLGRLALDLSGGECGNW